MKRKQYTLLYAKNNQSKVRILYLYIDFKNLIPSQHYYVISINKLFLATIFIDFFPFNTCKNYMFSSSRQKFFLLKKNQ